jgi:hypothetical protein
VDTLDDKRLDDPRMVNVVVWKQEFLNHTIKNGKEKGRLRPQQLWNPSHDVK